MRKELLSMGRDRWARARGRARALLLLCGWLGVAGGLSCTSPSTGHRTAGAALDDQTPAWSAIDSGRYQLLLQHLATLRNTGLELPRASPDGRWIATLSSPNALALDADAALTGRTLDDVTLVLHSVTNPKSPPRTIAAAAAWAVWSPDSRRVVAVSYDRSHRCGLIIHDLSTGQTRRLEIGLTHIITPAFSPTGTQLALCGFAETPEQSRLYVYDLVNQRLTPLPAPKDCLWQILPMWVNEHALLYYGRVGAETGLFGAAADASRPSAWLARVPLPPDAAEALRTQSGIAQPLASGGQWLALFDGSARRIILHHLDDSRAWPLSPMSQSGAWVQPAGESQPRFIFATDTQCLLASPGGDTHLLGSTPFLPLWCNAAGTRLLVAAPGKQDWTLELVQMRIQPAAARPQDEAISETPSHRRRS
jgi:hypothetical protein